MCGLFSTNHPGLARKIVYKRREKDEEQARDEECELNFGVETKDIDAEQHQKHSCDGI